MNLSLFLSMSAFALVSSITPGPVNIVALDAGSRFGFRSSLRHVSGATVGFTLLLWLTGFGLHSFLLRWPMLNSVICWVGIAFLLFIAARLANDSGLADADGLARPPSFFHGAMMQWLNPKAWLASVAGMSAYATSGEIGLISQFTALYFVICYLSIACWAYVGNALQRLLRTPRQRRRFNRVMAALLAVSALGLLWR